MRLGVFIAGVLVERYIPVLIGVAALQIVKVLVLSVLGRAYSLPTNNSTRLAAFLSQGGEFGFVAFTLAAGYMILSVELKGMLILVVTISMALTPLTLLLTNILTDLVVSVKY